MWNQPCFNTPPNTGGQWVYLPGTAGGPPSPPSPVKAKSAKKMLKQMLEDRRALDEAIKMLEDSKKKKPEPNGKGFGLIHQSMFLMLTAVPIGILDIVLIRMLNK